MSDKKPEMRGIPYKVNKVVDTTAILIYYLVKIIGLYLFSRWPRDPKFILTSIWTTLEDIFAYSLLGKNETKIGQ